MQNRWIRVGVLIAFCSLSSALFAHGSSDIDSKDTEALKSWNETVDITSKYPGKYNVLTTATDIAGNEGIVGPFNIFIDPKSDLPVVRISNPVDGLTVIGNVNIVGTAIDDDGVDYVELRIDSSEETYRAKGKEFWSYFLDTSSLAEGVHTISAWAVDINGVQGEPFSSTFNLNRRQPETVVTNYGVGKLVSGVVTFEGTVADGNGIDRLMYSLDSGLGYREVPIYFDSESGKYTFSLSFDTKTMEEGPQVCWFKAFDKQGAAGVYTYLFFVDNTAPEVSFVYPSEEDGAVGPVFSVAGKASDTVGLDSLSWRAGAASGDIEIIKGNIYWVKEFDLTSVGSATVPIEIIAKDRAGNISIAKKDVTIDRSIGIPSIEVASPVNNADISGAVYFAGFGKDVYGLKEIVYRVDGGQEQRVAAPYGPFSIDIPNLPVGQHTITAYPVNIYGVSGTPVNTQFNVTAENEAREGDLQILLDSPSVEGTLARTVLRLRGQVLGSVATVTCAVADLPPINLSASFDQAVNIASFADGFIPVTVTATSPAGDTVSVHRAVYKLIQTPDVKMVVPTADEVVNGSVLAAFKVNSEFPIVSAEYNAGLTSSNWEPMVLGTLPHALIGTSTSPISNRMQFRFSDKAGNSTVLSNFDFTIDNDADKPRIEVHLPEDNAVIFKDFVLSGIVFDDDGAAKIFYKVDDGPFKSMDIENTFAIPLSLSEFSDNVHRVTLYAEDLYGVRSNSVVRTFRVSTAVPSTTITAPQIDTTVKGIVTIAGTSKDANGIDRVEISLDNGNTYNVVEGTTNWSYKVNSNIIDDGSHVVFVKVFDKYGQVEVVSHLITIDNTPPVVRFEYPLSGGQYDQTLFIAGQAVDNIALSGINIRINGLEGQTVPRSLANFEIKDTKLITQEIDISNLSEGNYNLQILARDKSDNTSEISRNFQVVRGDKANRIEFLYPLNGETVVGEFNVYGQVISHTNVKSVTLLIDGEEAETVDVSKTTYYSFPLNVEKLTDGEHTLQVKADFGGRMITSDKYTISYKAAGPWVTIDNFAMGDFAKDRPYIRGRAGYTLSETDKAILNSREAYPEEKRAVYEKTVEKIDISFDNGKTFKPLRGTSSWKYRVETGDIPEGSHFMLVRATMTNKEVATVRTIVRVDKTPPNVLLVSPGEGAKYNESIQFAGLATDEVALDTINYQLRSGDKDSYGIPKFIQGLHFEAGFWGASLWNVGLGLSFFENNVKVQLHYGQFLDSQYRVFYKTADVKKRYGGHIMSLKLLANVFDIPFGYYFGPDLNWFHMTGAIGANFSLFTQTQSGKPQVLAALLTQIELPRVKFEKQKYFSSFAFFVEGSLWFIPTDVKGPLIKSVIPHLACGMRFDVF